MAGRPHHFTLWSLTVSTVILGVPYKPLSRCLSVLKPGSPPSPLTFHHMFSEELLGLYILISASATCTLVRLQTGQSWKHLNIECPAGCHCSSCRKTMRQPALRGFTTNHVWAPCCLLSPRSDCFKPGKRHDQQVRKEVGGLAQNIRAPLFFIFRHYASQLHLCKPKYKLIRWKIVGNWTVCVCECVKSYMSVMFHGVWPHYNLELH